jgi:hypothetical protein
MVRKFPVPRIQSAFPVHRKEERNYRECRMEVRYGSGLRAQAEGTDRRRSVSGLTEISITGSVDFLPVIAAGLAVSLPVPADKGSKFYPQ